MLLNACVFGIDRTKWKVFVSNQNQIKASGSERIVVRSEPKDCSVLSFHCTSIILNTYVTISKHYQYLKIEGTLTEQKKTSDFRPQMKINTRYTREHGTRQAKKAIKVKRSTQAPPLEKKNNQAS